jgi:CBS domain-containing protein
MTTSDFANAVKKSFDGGGSPNVMRSTITEMLSSEDQCFLHADFNSIDAEDSVHQLCASLSRYDSEYVPVVDPDEGSLVAILGYMDILFLLVQMTDRFPLMFSATVESALLAYVKNVPTVPRSTCLSDVFDIIEDRDVKCVAVANATGRVDALYQTSDADFMASIVSDTLLQSFGSRTLGDVVDFKSDGNDSVVFSCFCAMHDTIKNVVEQMVHGKTTKLLCMDGAGESLGIITVRDIVSYIFDGDVHL